MDMHSTPGLRAAPACERSGVSKSIRFNQTDAFRCQNIQSNAWHRLSLHGYKTLFWGYAKTFPRPNKFQYAYSSAILGKRPQHLRAAKPSGLPPGRPGPAPKNCAGHLRHFDGKPNTHSLSNQNLRQANRRPICTVCPSGYGRFAQWRLLSGFAWSRHSLPQMCTRNQAK